MRLYKVFWFAATSDDYDGESDEGRAQTWWSSRRAAESELARLKREGEVADTGPSGVDEVTINLTRAGLLQWLNANCTTGGG